ncbi:MAG: DUF481 domain-containing protein [Acidobacteriota bacterium]
MSRTSAVILLLAFVVGAPVPMPAQVLKSLKEKKVEHKDDVVVLENGDRLTGEIRKVEFGMLYLKSDRVADTLRLDWNRVTRLQSTARYEFEIKTGQHHVGVIAPDPNEQVPAGMIEVLLDDRLTVRWKIGEVLAVREMQRAILGRLNLSLDMGIGFTSGNKQTQTTVGASAAFVKPKYMLALDLSSVFSRASGVTNTSRHELRLSHDQVVSTRWSVVFLAGLLHDNQQDLDLRTTIGAGWRRTVFKSNRTSLSVVGGIVYTNENYFPEARSDRNNAEIVSGVSYTGYRFRGSEISASAYFFPSLSDPGRVRIDTYAYCKWELVKDLYWKISLTENYDSRPPEEGTTNNLNATSSVGWSF